MNGDKMIFPAIAIGLCVFSAVPAAAQYGAPAPPPPSAAPPAAAPAAPSEAAAPDEVLVAAACAIGRDPRTANNLLAALPRSPEERTAAMTFLRAAERCVRNDDGLRTSAMTLRGAAAEIFYETQFATAPAPRTPPLEAKPLTRPAAGNPVATELEPSYALVDCTVPKQPALVRALLTTNPGSEAEIAALTALNPTFLTCVARNARIAIDPHSIRTMFAEALYHWALVQRDGPTSPWAAAPAAPAPAQ